MLVVKQVFNKTHVVLPVIHVKNIDQAKNNVAIAKEAGSDGVFLINHHQDCNHLHYVYKSLKSEFPGFWMGCNFLGLSNKEAFELGEGVNGIWTDNALEEETEAYAEEMTEIVSKWLRYSDSNLYFGGIEFKYQLPSKDVVNSCKLANRFVDIITTSGPGTGESPTVEKIKNLKEINRARPLAIASGITPENVTDFMPETNCFLVATGISKNFTELDPDKVKSLVNKVNSYGSEI